jgi:GTP-binding protein
LKAHDAALFRKQRWLVFNKIDAVEDADARVARIVRALRWKRPWFKVSALTGQGCPELIRAIARELGRKT